MMRRGNRLSLSLVLFGLTAFFVWLGLGVVLPRTVTEEGAWMPALLVVCVVVATATAFGAATIVLADDDRK